MENITYSIMVKRTQFSHKRKMNKAIMFRWTKDRGYEKISYWCIVSHSTGLRQISDTVIIFNKSLYITILIKDVLRKTIM